MNFSKQKKNAFNVLRITFHGSKKRVREKFNRVGLTDVNPKIRATQKTQREKQWKC